MRTILLFIITFLWAAVFTCNYAAVRNIRGQVVDADDGQGLPGVSVTLKTSSSKPLGVMTDANGAFELNIPEGVTEFTCSYVSYATQTVSLTEADFYRVVLTPSETALSEVVVTGYQTVERRKLTAAISRIDLSEEKTGMIHAVDQALAGQIAGLSALNVSGAPGAPLKIRIRGTASLNGTQDPLWVLDGIPLEGAEVPKTEDLKDIDELYSTSIAGLNPADIESITVLKDAAATAIYGARAANGVIVVTTRNGKKGKPVINFSSKFAYSPNIDISRLNLMNAREKVNLELELLRSDFTYRSNKGGVARILEKNGLTADYLTHGWDGLPPAVQSDINALKEQATDWNRILFRDAFSQEYNLSISGADDRLSYYTSAAYYREEGNVQGVSTDRFNITAKTNYSLNKILKVGASLFANRRTNTSYLSDYDGFTNPVYYSRRVSPYQQLFDGQGKYIYDFDIQGKGDSNLNFNIFEERQNTSNQNLAHSVSAIFDAVARFSDHFNITTQLGLQSDFSSVEKVADAESYAMRKEHERATRINHLGQRQSFLPRGGMHKQTETRLSQATWKLIGNYSYNYRNAHEIEGMLGTELRRTWYESLFSAGYGYDRQMLTTEAVLFPKAEDARLFPLHLKTHEENAYVSAFGTLSYSYRHRYTLGGSIRFDGSNIYGVDPRYRYLPLYSVSALWRLSNESFLKGISAIDNLALRTSYGLQGNIDKNTSPFVMGTYQTLQILPGTLEKMIVISTPPNKKLRWEKTESFNLGLDLALFNQAISFSMDYYYRLGSDLIGLQMLPLETGFTATTINWAAMSNRGVEFSLTTRNIHTKHFMWFTNLNIGFNTNTVLRESVPANQTTPERIGFPVSAIFALKSAGLDAEGYPLYYNKAGEKQNLAELFRLTAVGPSAVSALSPEQQRKNYYYVGQAEPPLSGGLGNTFTYRGFQLGVNCTFNLGAYARVQPSYSMVNYDRGLNSNRDILHRWTESNPGGPFPTLINNGKRPAEYAWYTELNLDALSDRWVKKVNYMRVQSIRLGYELPSEFIQRAGIQACSLALEGRNLFLLASDYSNFLDPETMGNPFAQPIPKSLILSLNLKL